MKKGDLNLSIQVIVIVVIAFVVLGLGLQFVRSQFRNIEETAGSVQEQVRQQILDDLRTGNKKLSFPATTITMEKGGSRDIAIGVKNTGDVGSGNLVYKLGIEKLQKQGELPDNIGDTATWAGEIDFFFDTTGTSTLSSTDVRVHPIRVTANPSSGGTYLFKLVIEYEESPGTFGTYDEKTFFVTVN